MPGYNLLKHSGNNSKTSGSWTNFKRNKKNYIYIYKTENKNIMANIYRLEAYDSIMCECVDTFLLIYRFYGKKAC